MAVFSPSFAEEILVHYILADLESKVLHLWLPNFLQPNSQTSAPPSAGLGHAKFSASLASFRESALI